MNEPSMEWPMVATMAPELRRDGPLGPIWRNSPTTANRAPLQKLMPRLANGPGRAVVGADG